MSAHPVFAACVAIAAMAGAPTWLALVLLPAAVVVHTIGELWQAAGGFELSFTLHAVRQYQGLFGRGLGLGVTLGPAVLIALCITWALRAGPGASSPRPAWLFPRWSAGPSVTGRGRLRRAQAA
ncbi:hypothetical protein [Amycolatopsis australiensis]|uniref:hypothetical protein n=1 Tax=Amycolatopsis australiensis TaxID=546364 RepID=UPI000930E9FF|nr:hypothetical protein [Amycolatopsis australiensis]